MYELKTVDAFVGAHFTQIYHYATCLDITFIKLLNFLPMRVDGKLRACPITAAIRHTAQVSEQSFQPVSPRCELLREHVHAVVSDFGGFLEASLYTEALAALINAPEVRLAVSRDGIQLGTHPMYMVGEQVGFHVSSFGDLNQHCSHLTRLLATLPLRALHWINFNKQHVTLTTLRRSGC